MSKTIEQSRASAIAAFRAGRRAGHLDALRIICEMMDEIPELSVKKVLFDACDAIQRFAPGLADQEVK